MSIRDDELFTPEEIAGKLKLSKYTIYEMIKRGEISAHRIGRSLRISATQFETYLIQSRQSVNSYEADLTIGEDGEKIASITGEDGTIVELTVVTDMPVGNCRVTVKPEDIILSKDRLSCSAQNNLEGRISGMEETDISYKLTVNVGVPLVVHVTKRTVRTMDLHLGDFIVCIFKATAVSVA